MLSLQGGVPSQRRLKDIDLRHNVPEPNVHSQSATPEAETQATRVISGQSGPDTTKRAVADDPVCSRLGELVRRVTGPRKGSSTMTDAEKDDGHKQVHPVVLPSRQTEDGRYEHKPGSVQELVTQPALYELDRSETYMKHIRTRKKDELRVTME